MRALAAGALLLLAGCIPSLHPFYTARDLAFDPLLLGTWVPQDEKQTWAFSAHEPDAYRLVYTDDKGRAGRFKVRLLRLEGKTFLDLYPADPPGELNEYYKAHLVKAHTFLHVRELARSRLELAGLSFGWLDRQLKAEPGAIAHERRNGQVVFTADTRALQAFVLKHLGTRDAFGKPLVLARARKEAD